MPWCQGLGRSGFHPQDREHIGLARASLSSPTSEQQTIDVPFEWFRKSDNNQTKYVLVLWINEIPIRERPLAGLKQIVEQTCACVSQREPVVIGPSSSDTLQAMMYEVIHRAKTAEKESEKDTFQVFLKNLKIYSPKATAPDEHLLQSVGLGSAPPPSASSSYCINPHWSKSIASALKSEVPGLEFHRTIATDCALIVALSEELRIRGVQPDDGIVLISEWDTAYGRALPGAFREVIMAKRTRVPEEDPLWNFSYLRGLDGILPGEGVDKKPDSIKADREKEDAAIEPAFGNHQKDYLRRIAARVAKHDQDLKAGGRKEGVKAIGILGSDVYDKLLILRALHPRFPEVIFFTTDLDARLLHAEEWETARNLVVASGYGLSLNGRLQREIPPFRDGYQTAYFLSVLTALADPGHQAGIMDSVERWSWRPRLFEIGRSQPVDLSISMQDTKPCDLATCNAPYPHVKPPARPDPGWFASLAGLFLLTAWYLHRGQVARFLREAKEGVSMALKPSALFQRRDQDQPAREACLPWYHKLSRLLSNKWIIEGLLGLALDGLAGMAVSRHLG